MREVALPVAPSDPVADALLARLPASPDVYPQKIDLIRDLVLLIGFDADAYRAASFLDDRVLTPTTQGGWVPLPRVADLAGSSTTLRPLHFIFHTGHVGSTLVSRLLDETGEVLSLREPLPLRTLAETHDSLGRPESLLGEAQFEALLAMCVRLWRRGYGTTRAVVLKATSSCGRVAVPILARNESTRAIYMNLRAEPYLATLLAGQNSVFDLRGHGPERIRRLQSRLASPLAPLHMLSPGELTAMSWLAERVSQLNAVTCTDGRVIAVDFDAFLADIEGGMATVLGHFGLSPDPRFLARVGRSPILARYSKAPEFAYTPEVRAQVLRESRRDHRDEIARGMDWLAQKARADPVAAEALRETGT
jgi:hypothetical protein